MQFSHPRRVEIQLDGIAAFEAVLVLGFQLLQLLRDLRPDLRLREFLVWVIVFYFALLAIETRFLLKSGESRVEG